MMSKTIYALLLCTSVLPLPAQDLARGLKAIQVHGFVTQGLLYSSHNNYLEANSSDGNPGWSEGVISLSATPVSKLRIGVQVHCYRLGVLGNGVPSIDWALADYKFNGYLGTRAGKIKRPLGLFNDSQDLDAVHLWSILPQAAYPIDNRSYYLSLLGGELYGSTRLGPHRGSLTYRAYAGHNSLALNGGFVSTIASTTGLIVSKPPAGPVKGGDLRWQTSNKQLLIGTSLQFQTVTGTAPTGSLRLAAITSAYYAQLDRGKFYLAGEFRLQPIDAHFQIGPYPLDVHDPQHQWYVMSSYRITGKLQAGAYYSHSVDSSTPAHQQVSSSKDLVFSTRYDFNSSFYAKAEDHLLHGTQLGYYPADNPGGLVSRTNLVVAKLGFYF